MSGLDGIQLDLDDVFLERLIESLASTLRLPATVVAAAVVRFLQAETSKIDAINAVMALGVHKRPGGPNDGAT